MAGWSNGLDGITWVIEIGFASAPSTAVGATAWTDVTADVRDVSIDAGRSTSLDDFQAGRATVILDSRARQYDPKHATGPHFGQLLPRKRIRIKCTVGANTWVAFCGYIKGWPQTFSLGGDSIVALACVDGFDVLNRTILRSVYATEVLADSPSVWWRLGDAGGTVAADASGNSRDGTYIGGATFNSRDGLVIDSLDAAIGFDPTVPMGATATLPWPVAPFSVELWFNVPTPAVPADAHALLFVTGSSNAASVRVTLSDQGVHATFGDNTVVIAADTGIHNYYDGNHHLVVVYAAGATVPVIYVDGVNATGSGSALSAPAALASGTVQLPLPVTGVLTAFTATIDEFAVYPSALSSGRVAAHYSAGTAPWAGLTTDGLITAVLDAMGWPAADRLLETGASTVQYVDTAGRSALEILKLAEKTEQGKLFIGPCPLGASVGGQIEFHNRWHPFATAAGRTIAANFSDIAGSSYPYEDLTPDFGDDLIRNTVTAQRRGGTSVTITDAASVTANGTYGDSVTGLLSATELEVRDLANWRTVHFKDPAYRFTKLTVNPRGFPATLPALMVLMRIGLRVNVIHQPRNNLGAAVGSQISQDAFIEGISLVVSRDLIWTVTFYLSPIDVLFLGAVLDDTTYGVLDTVRLGF